MSDTDDTDDLLLIPPDLFVIQSDTDDLTQLYGPYYNVVENLISQVNKLEDRIYSIESNSETNLSNLNNESLMSKHSWEADNAEYSASVQSTPQKPKTKLKVNSLPSTPSTERYLANQHVQSYDDLPNYNSKANKGSIPSHRTRENVLNEIDRFLTNVNTIKKYDPVQNLENKFIESENGQCVKDLKTNDVNTLSLHDINNILTSVDSRQQYIESRLKAAENKSENNNTQNYANCYNIEDRIGTYTVVPLEKLPLSDLSSTTSNNLSSRSDTTQTTVFNKQQLRDIKNTSKRASNLEKIHTNALQVLNAHKNISGQFANDHFDRLSEDSPVRDEELMSQKKLVLINLEQLWNNSEKLNSIQKSDHFKCVGKIQEEKLRREHCEHLIQQLQIQTLEFQEKIAVALKVDKAKDEAIIQLHSSWEETVSRVDELLQINESLKDRLSITKCKFSMELEEAIQKTSHFEIESSKALSLAHSNHEKLESYVKINEQLTNELKNVKEKLEETLKKYKTEIEKNDTSNKIIHEKNTELQQKQRALAEASKEVSQSKKTIERCHNELKVMKDEQNRLESQINLHSEERKMFKAEKIKLRNELDDQKNVEKILRQDLQRQRFLGEESKIELRNFYQNQLEIVVKEKLQEFQAQLDKAEAVLKDEIKNREIVVAKTAAAYIQQITEKHEMEIQLLEEKHKEEVKLQELRSSQLQQQIDTLHKKLQEQQERRAQVAKQLHHVMETQWLEALKILNNGKSPSVSQDKSTNTINQLNHLKSKSFSNVEEILKEDVSHKNSNDKQYQTIGSRLDALDSTSVFLNEQRSENHSQYSSINYAETPVSSRLERNKLDVENDLQKYVQLLLNKIPSNTKMNGASENDGQNTAQKHSVADDILTENSKSNKNLVKERATKPPWK